MIQITENAREKLLASLNDHDGNPAVRIYVAGAG
jgi:Fe-S cluster assembly iron-binding protein IscA